MALKLNPNMSDPDSFYEALIRAHDGLSMEQSTAMNARLVLILANQIGSQSVLEAAIETAKAG